MSQPIIFVTGNQGKAREAQKILKDMAKIEIFDVDLPELQEEPRNIAYKKCELAYEEIRKVKGDRVVMVEDTSLCFNALNGLPGPYIKAFLKKLGNVGLNKILEGFEDKSAQAWCVVAIKEKQNENPRVFIGKTKGKIVMPRGDNNFGWDPIFEPDEGEGKTFAEMDIELKNKISHRYRAFEKLYNYFKEKQN